MASSAESGDSKNAPSAQRDKRAIARDFVW
jgi:hypothetical protein